MAAVSRQMVWGKGKAAAGVVRRNLVFILILAALAWLILAPMTLLIMNSFRLGHPAMPEGWTVSNYQLAFANPMLYGALFNTFFISVVATFITLSVAVLFAWLVERTDMPLRNLAWALLIIPMAFPGILFVLGWALLLAPRAGALNVPLRHLLSLVGLRISQGPFDIFSLGGLIWLDGIRGVTTLFVMIVGAFRMMDPNLEEAARVGGATAWQTFRRVTLPLLLPAVLMAGMYSFISSMDSFEAPLAVGMPGGVFVLSTLMYFQVRLVAPMNYGLAAVYAVLFMGIMAALIVLYRRVVMRRTERWAVITGRGYMPRVASLGRWRLVAFGLFVAYFALSVVAPFLILLWTSLLPSYRPVTSEAAHLLSLKNYVTVLTFPGLLGIVRNTVVMTVAAATATMLFCFLLSWIIVRSHVPGRGMVDGITFLSHSIPGIIVALAFIMLYLTPPFRYFGLYGTIWLIVLAISTQYLAFGTRIMNGAIVQVHRDLEEMAFVSGASQIRVWFRITLPLVFSTFAAGWIWVSVHAMRTFSIPLMLASRANEVLSVRIWEFWDSGNYPEAAALGILLTLLLVPIAVAARRWIVRVTGGR